VRRPSGTARLIAAAMVLSSHDRRLRDLVTPEAVQWSARLLAACPEGSRLLRSMGRPTGRAVLRLIDRLTSPGIIRHWMLRKRRIGRLTEAAAADGFTQLLVLGAGLDTLAFRSVGRFERVIALDHATSQESVRKAAGENSDVRFVTADLAHERLGDVLRGALDPGAPTLVIAEGLLMYIPEAGVRTLLQDAAALPCPRLRLIATYMERFGTGPIGFRSGSRLVRIWLKRRGEPMRWSIGDEEVPGFLAQCGWQHRTTVRAAELSREHDPSRRPFVGENLFVAER
jgi:methyltransferase (TIGR00027 family)